MRFWITQNKRLDNRSQILASSLDDRDLDDTRTENPVRQHVHVENMAREKQVRENHGENKTLSRVSSVAKRECDL